MNNNKKVVDLKLEIEKFNRSLIRGVVVVLLFIFSFVLLANLLPVVLL